MRARRLLVSTVFLLSALVVAGCGDSSPATTNTAPTEKQLQKEKMKPDAGSGKQKSR